MTLTLFRICGDVMKRNHRGFTIIELVIVLVISIVLAGLITLSFSRVQGQLGVQAAQNNFLSLHAQARAFAVERGTEVRFVVDESLNEFRVEWDDPATGARAVLNQVSVGREFNVEVTTSRNDLIQLCFTPRALANPSCVGGLEGSATVTMQRGNRTASVTLLELGQARETP